MSKQISELCDRQYVKNTPTAGNVTLPFDSKFNKSHCRKLLTADKIKRIFGEATRSHLINNSRYSLFSFHIDSETLSILHRWFMYTINMEVKHRILIIHDVIQYLPTSMIVMYMMHIIQHMQYVCKAKLWAYVRNHTDCLMLIKVIRSRILYQIVK